MKAINRSCQPVDVLIFQWAAHPIAIRICIPSPTSQLPVPLPQRHRLLKSQSCLFVTQHMAGIISLPSVAGSPKHPHPLPCPCPYPYRRLYLWASASILIAPAIFEMWAQLQFVSHFHNRSNSSSSSSRSDCVCRLQLSTLINSFECIHKTQTHTRTPAPTIPISPLSPLSSGLVRVYICKYFWMFVRCLFALCCVIYQIGVEMMARAGRDAFNKYADALRQTTVTKNKKQWQPQTRIDIRGEHFPTYQPPLWHYLAGL